jgi:membrane protease subunit HflC
MRSGVTKKVIGLILAVFAVLFYSAAYVVDEREQTVVTRWGQIKGKPETTPGLKLKVPFLDKVHRFPKNLQNWDGVPGQVPTLDKTFIWVDSFARWRIVDAVQFKISIGSLSGARDRLDDIIDPAVRNAITSNKLIETVRWTNRTLDTMEVGLEDEDKPVIGKVHIGRQEITSQIRDAAAVKLKEFGIELVDVEIKRLNYVQQVREAVYKRMIAERRQIAEKFRSEGQGEARRIRGEMEKELKKIQSEAYRTGETKKGAADAEATRIYAEAYGRDPEFYSFTKTLDSYREALGKDTSVVLSTESGFFSYLKSIGGNLGGE